MDLPAPLTEFQFKTTAARDFGHGGFPFAEVPAELKDMFTITDNMWTTDECSEEEEDQDQLHCVRDSMLCHLIDKFSPAQAVETGWGSPSGNLDQGMQVGPWLGEPQLGSISLKDLISEHYLPDHFEPANVLEDAYDTNFDTCGMQFSGGRGTEMGTIKIIGKSFTSDTLPTVSTAATLERLPPFDIEVVTADVFETCP